MPQYPSDEFERIKLYTVKISKNIKPGYWYKSKAGQEYHTVLICKDSWIGIIPCFLVVSPSGEGIASIGTVRTIRPEDCEILHEEIANVNIRKTRGVKIVGQDGKYLRKAS